MKTIEDQKHQRKRQLTIQYMVAVTLVFLVSLSSLLIIKHILKQQEGYAAVINISGRQRMLSQQIALLAHEIVTEGEQEGKENLKGQIGSSISLMRESHQHLISGKEEDNTGVALSAALFQMYFHPPLEVDRLVGEYLAAIEAIIAVPVTEESLRELSVLAITARTTLLTALNRVVQEYETESIKYSKALTDSALIIFLLMVLLLGLIVVFGFRPMAHVVAENEGMLNSILDSIPILMDIVNKEEGTILYQSKFLLDRLGESAVGQKCFEAYKTDQIQCDACPTGKELPDLETKVTTCFDRFGSRTIIQMTHLPILFKGEEAFLHTFQDITEQQKSEAFLIRAKEEADHASKLKSNFLANMSHEIRTPMNAIIGFSDLALETELTAQQQDYLAKINQSSHSLLKIIGKILDFSKIEAGKVELEKKAFSLQEILHDLTLLFTDKAREKGIELVSRQESDIPASLIGDALRLQQILVNLVDNALKFTEQGEVSIQVKLLGITAQQAIVEFSVSDTGVGIPSDAQLTLFDSFSQADGSSTRKYGGAGLGLTISRQLVELLGGVLKVSSEEGVGSVFTFTAAFELFAVGMSGSKEERESGTHEEDSASRIRGAQERRQIGERRENSGDRRKKTEGYHLPERLICLDMKQGLARLEGNSELYFRLLQEFAAETRSMEEKILEAIESKDQKSAERLVHTVKGMSGILGAMDLAAASLDLEMVLKEGGEIKVGLARFAESLQQVLQSIAALTDAQNNLNTIAEKSQPVSEEEVARRMAELTAMLHEKNFQSGSKWNELKQLLPMLTEEKCQQLDHALNSFEFETALKMLAEIDIRLSELIAEKGSGSNV